MRTIGRRPCLFVFYRHAHKRVRRPWMLFLSGQKGRKMKTEARKIFIINCMYFTILLAAAFVLLKYGLPMVAPFVTAFVIAYLLRRPICFASGRLPMNRKITAILMVLLCYSVAGLLFTLLCVKMFSNGKTLVASLPSVYANYAEPVVTGIFGGIEQYLLRMDPSLLGTLEELEGHFVQSAGQMVSGISMEVMGWLSGFASSLPGMFITLLLMVITTFFIAADYELLTGFCLRQLGERPKEVFMEIQSYVVGTLFVCIRSYALIMTITFVELSIGLTLIGVENSLVIAFLIAVFDILPVLGTGGIMIPWTVITALTGSHGLALGLLVVYLVITVVRNIIEPKIVGSQIGLHPVVTLVSMFVGAQLLGVLGLFGFPIGLSLLRYLNETGSIRLFKTAGEESQQLFHKEQI